MRGLRGVGIQGLAHPVFSAASPGGDLMSTILSYNPIAYWPLNELSGTAAINYGSLGTVANGTYSGATLAQMAAPGGGLAPYFDGNDRVNIYTAAFAAGFSGILGTALAFAKVHNVGVWTDSTQRFALCLSDGGYHNRVMLEKTSTNNTGKFDYRANDVQEEQTYTSTSTDWVVLSITWTDAGDQVIYYRNGSQEGGIDTGIGTWAIALGAATTNIGCSQNTIAHWYGYISHVAIYTSVLTPQQVASIHASSGI